MDLTHLFFYVGAVGIIYGTTKFIIGKSIPYLSNLCTEKTKMADKYGIKKDKER